MSDGDDDVVDAEIVDDDGGDGPGPLVPADTILTPCHHGCTCGLHQQTLYGERVQPHEPTILDHGEMGLLVEAARDAARVLNNFHDHFRKLRMATTHTLGDARRAVDDLRALLNSDALRTARAERDAIEVKYADLGLAERQPVPRWLRSAAVAAAAGMAIFDAYFFQQTFLNILQVRVGAPWWQQDIGLVAALVLAIGLIAAGRVLSGPIWRMGQRWRRPASPDDEPLRAAIRIARVVAVGAAPAATFFVLGWWAQLRGQAASVEQLALEHGLAVSPPVPTGFSVMLLLLSMALAVIVLEVLVYNPYQAELRRSDRALSKLRKRITVGNEAVMTALDAHEIAWRDLRSARDEVIAFVLAELARPWETVILPARLRHGKAGPKPAEPKHDVKIAMGALGTATRGITEADNVTITYQIFEGVAQPQPAPGPLAEVVRAVIDYDPEALRAQHKCLEQSLHTQLADATRGPEMGDSDRPHEPGPEPTS